ncbi:solute:Na+ symporter, SSS family, partial [Nocardioides terrae]
LATFWGTDTKVYVALMALLINLVIAIAGTLILRALKVPDGVDSTAPADYSVDVGDTGVEPELSPGTPAH